MSHRSTDARKFKSEAEEADWYATPEGRRQTEREFTRALRDGTLVRSAGMKAPKTDAKVLQQLMEQAKEHATRAISIRIPVADLERAKLIAKKTGIKYQAVLKQAIRKGLATERSRRERMAEKKAKMASVRERRANASKQTNRSRMKAVRQGE